jgi:hypothetical protein
MLKSSPYYNWYMDWRGQINLIKEAKQLAREDIFQYDDWLRNGKPIPPPRLYKQNTVREYGREFSLDTLIETGTYLGEMLNAVNRNFKNIFSIELGTQLYIRALKLFLGKKNIVILHGNSGEMLKEILPMIDRPCLFWLDAHYSEGITAKAEKETPILDELAGISSHAYRLEDVILIDDARCFGTGDYPSIEWMKEWSIREGYEHFEVKDDIIRIHSSRRANSSSTI